MTDPKEIASDLTRTVIQDARELQQTCIHEMASALEEGKNQIVSDLSQAMLHTANRQINEASNYLRGRTTRQLLDDLGRAARRQPALFVAAAFGLGFFTVKLLKSPEQRRTYRETSSRIGTDSPAMEVGYAGT